MIYRRFAHDAIDAKQSLALRILIIEKYHNIQFFIQDYSITDIFWHLFLIEFLFFLNFKDMYAKFEFSFIQMKPERTDIYIYIYI